MTTALLERKSHSLITSYSGTASGTKLGEKMITGQQKVGISVSIKLKRAIFTAIILLPMEQY